jgi:uncharacterized membrane protein
MQTFNETYTRTTIKSVLYRLFSVTLAITLTLAFGGTIEQALKFGIASLLTGIAIYYIYDRIWVKINWLRDDEGKDAKIRSAIKSVLYRFIAWLTVVAFARTMWAPTDFVAILMATTQFTLNLIIYFISERVWNEIAWGKIIEEEQVNTV